MNELIDLLIFLIPIYVANSAPVLLGGGRALDFDIVFFDNKRILGRSKTLRGFLSGTLAGTVAGGLVAASYALPFFSNSAEQFIGAFFVSLGAMVGDSFGSFIKRRLDMESGKAFWPDTMIFVIMALVFVFPFADLELYQPFNVVFFLILTLVLHPLTNSMANAVGLKKVPW